MGILAGLPGPPATVQRRLYAFIREGRACRRQRHADAGGRSEAVARRPRGSSEHRSFVNDQPSAAADTLRARRLTSFGPTGYPPVTAMCRSAVHGHGRPGWTPRASCPSGFSPHPPRIPGGVLASRRIRWSLRPALGWGVEEEERGGGGLPPRPASCPARPKARRASCPPKCRCRGCRPPRARRPARWRVSAPRPSPCINRLLVHYCTCVVQKPHCRFSRGKPRFSADSGIHMHQ